MIFNVGNVTMLSKLKKAPRYLFKFIRSGSFQDVVHIVQHVEPRHVFSAIRARIDRTPTELNFKRGIGRYEINTLLDLLKCRKKQINKDLYQWDYHGRKFYGNILQFIGLYSEYLTGAFDHFYSLDWKGKRVLDVGGFIGDSALYFLENGANHVVIYEPSSENIVALVHNLAGYADKIEIHQKAIAEKDCRVQLFSQEPSGSLGFGAEQGRYFITCDGCSFKTLINKHSVDIAKIDCEGAEKYLEQLSQSEIQSIPYWMIETHNLAIYHAVVNKFHSSGFTKLKDITLNSSVNLLHFKRESINEK